MFDQNEQAVEDTQPAVDTIAPETSTPEPTDKPQQAEASADESTETDLDAVEEDGDDEDLFGPELPDWFDEFNKAQGGKKKHKVDPKAFDQSTELRLAYINMRNAFNGKMQGAADLQKKLQDEHKKLVQERRSFADEKKKFYSTFQSPEFAKFTTPPEGEEPEIWTAEGVDFRAKKASAEHLSGFRSFVQQQAEQAEQERMEAERAEQLAEARERIARHAAENPDFKNYIPQIKELRKQHPSMDAIMAYKYLKGEENASRPQRLSPSEAARRKSAEVSGRPTRTSGATAAPTGVPDEVSEQGPLAVLRYLQENPEVQKGLLRQFKGR